MTREDRKRLIAWTGERCVPWADEPNVIHEHLHRYLFCRELVAGKRAVDLGSGEGYGAEILAEHAAEVIGVELDPLAVQHSEQKYARSNLRFVQGSALDLRGIESASVDVVVCFEVIEHLTDHEGLLNEITRVLRPEGVLVVSTPDRDVYNRELGHVNPYHLKELDGAELRALLSARLANVAIYGQRALSGSAIRALDAPDSAKRPAWIAVRQEADTWKTVPAPHPKYLIAVASNGRVPTLPADSLLLDAQPSARSSFRARHPLLGEAVLVGRSAIDALRVRLALMLRERNRRRGSS